MIPARNAAAVLASQLEAMATQVIQEDFEVIVADNGSTDKTAQLAASFVDRIDNLRVVDASAKPGSAFARNIGIRCSTGTRIVFADADDVVADHYVASMARALLDHEVVAAKIDWQLLNDWLPPDAVPRDQSVGVSGGMFAWHPFAFGGAMGVRRSAFNAVGGFSESVPRADDVEFCWRLALLGFSIFFVDEAVVHYRLRSGIRLTFRQSRANGEAGPWLYKHYREAGMPRHSASSAMRFWLGVVRACARVRSREDLYTCASVLGVRAGIIAGCVRHRVVYF